MTTSKKKIMCQPECLAAGKIKCGVAHRFSSRKYPNVHRPRFQSPLHFVIRNRQRVRSKNYVSSARRLLPADMLERWTHVCQYGVKITFALLLMNCFRVVSAATNSMKCLGNWSPLRNESTSVREIPNPAFKVN